jgi:transposase-like protein
MGYKVPPKMRKRAVELWGLGHNASDIARQLGCHAQSIRKWTRESGVSKGSLATSMMPSEEEQVIEIASAENLPLVREVNRQRGNAMIKQTIDAASTPAEQFQALVAAKGIRLLSEAFEAPPRPKNVRDLKTLAEMVSDALGISKKGGSGGKLAIDLTVLTKPSNQLTIDVTESDVSR